MQADRGLILQDAWPVLASILTNALKVQPIQLDLDFELLSDRFAQEPKVLVKKLLTSPSK